MSGALTLQIEAAAQQAAALEYQLHTYRNFPDAAERVAAQLQAARDELARLKALAEMSRFRQILKAEDCWICEGRFILCDRDWEKLTICPGCWARINGGTR